jgi:transcriptional regulator with XRE-family HTH domain
MPRPPPAKALSRRLGARIRALRVEAGVTQEQFAWDCDLDKGYMSNVESGKRLPSLQVLVAFAKRLGVEPIDLLAFDHTKPRMQLLDAARRGDREAVKEALKRMGLL